MADKQPIETVFQRLGSDKTGKIPHLQPLSIYSKMFANDGRDYGSNDPSWLPNSPFCKIKVEILNSSSSVSQKRQLDDSCLDETCETPQKKPCLSTCHSPDLACVLDSSLSELKNVTPEYIVVADKSKKAECSSSFKENPCDLKVTPSLKSLMFLRTNSSDESDSQSSSSLSFIDIKLSSSPVVFSDDMRAPDHAFDFDMDEIMCLSPIDRDEEQLSSNNLNRFLQSCQTFCEEGKLREHSEACESPKDWSSEGQGWKDRGTKSDEGYFSKSYKTEQLKESRNASTSVLQTLNLAMSSPLSEYRQLVKQPPLNEQLGYAEQCSPVVNQEALKSLISINGSMNLDVLNSVPKIPLDSNEKTEGEVRSVGTSIVKLNVCQSVQPTPFVRDSASLNKVSKDVLSVSQQAEPVFQVTFWEDTNPTKSSQTALPLPDQVKSKVVLIRSHIPEVDPEPAGNLAAVTKLPERKPQSRDHERDHGQVQRPVVFHREEDWEREKTIYMDSVVRHMKENKGTGDGVMTELLNLMNTVANQRNRGYARQWQHPSDLTQRNYQPCERGRLFTLDEWQNLNYRYERRFARVPQPFRRSAVL